MYPDLLTGDNIPQRHSPESYPSLTDAEETSVDELERFLDEPRAQVSSYPVNVQVYSDSSYRCIWCDKKFFGEEQLESHLTSKGHRTRLINMDISPYGMDSHYQEVEDYVANYGHNLYARLKQWPECIEETPNDWYCALCRKHFQTQRSVNMHLEDVQHGETYPRMEDEWQRPSHWPSCIVADGIYWKCELCNKKFNSDEYVDQHLQHERHLSRVREPPVTRAAGGSTDNRRVQAESKQMIERLAQFISFEDRKCRLCNSHFDTLRETENHADDLSHIARFFQFTNSSQIF